MPGESSSGQERDEPSVEFIEIDPSGRFGRYEDVLGKGAVKTVYKAFDELEGIEVAWNQVKVVDLRRNSVDLERLYSEVHLLKTLKHTNIIKFYSSWIDPMKDNVNFITEVFTSGTLRQYRKKHKQVDIRALKNWSRQILRGLCYLHSHDPPVIHRDLKCDNIFVNGNHGEIKIGDLGSAAILRYAHSARSVIGTPEFMAPELYEEDYNELVDIYAFGMCLLELVTFQYPYSECNNAAQIYKKVTSGIKPAALAEVKDPEIMEFIKKCIADVSKRLSARELLLDSFLYSDAENGSINYSVRSSSPVHPESGTVGLDFSVQGQRQDMNTMFLKLQIPDSTGQIRNIHFPFDIEEDTSVCVATEMVAELDLTDQDVTAIAAMIDAEIKAYVPDWKPEEVSDSDGPENEAAEEASASPASVHHQSVGVFLEHIPSQSDSRKVTSGDSPSPPQLDSDEDSSIEDCKSEDDSFNNDTHKEWRSNGSLMPKQHSDSPHQSESGDNEQDFASSTELTNSGGSSPSHRSNQDHESPPGSVSQLCGRGANSELHGGDDKHLHESLQEDVSTDFQPIIQKLENLLIEQRKEVDEIQREHNSAIAELLKGLTAEKHSEMLHTCRSKVKNMEQTHR